LVRARRVTATKQMNAFIAVASGAPTEIPKKAGPVSPSVGAAKIAP